MEGMIFDIQRFSTVDGPGIRSTVFFKGCNLKCKWCHNPEGQSMESQMLFYKNKCISCGKCAKVCLTKMKDCNLCGECTFYCPTDARCICGKKYTVEEVLFEVSKDKLFYEQSKGGVTCSGGECMLQIDFLVELLKKCKCESIHTAVDTAGNVPWEYFERVLPYTDLFLYDMKCYSEKRHIETTGVSNNLILGNLKKLSKVAEVLVRIPVVPEINASELPLMAQFLRENDITNVELLPYHRLGDVKYEALNMEYETYTVPSEEEIREFKLFFE